MTFINWSDSEEMIALLTEFVADERNDSQADSARAQFLTDLLAELLDLNETFAAISTDEAIEKLRGVHESVSRDFATDPVVVHVESCIEELERIRDSGSTR
jgi:hypothetical protein